MSRAVLAVLGMLTYVTVSGSGSGSGTRTVSSSGSGTRTVSGSGSGTRTGSGSGSGSGSGTRTGSGSGSGNRTVSGSGSGTRTACGELHDCDRHYSLHDINVSASRWDPFALEWRRQLNRRREEAMVQCKQQRAWITTTGVYHDIYT